MAVCVTFCDVVEMAASVRVFMCFECHCENVEDGISGFQIKWPPTNMASFYEFFIFAARIFNHTEYVHTNNVI